MLAIRLTTEPAQGRSPWLAFLVGHRYDFARLFIGAASATLFLGGRRLWEELRQTAKETQPILVWLPWLLCHLAAFTVFTGWLLPVLQGQARFFPLPLLGSFLWAVAGVAIVPSWCLAILPAKVWLRLLRREAAVFLAGAAVGTLACLAGWLADRLWQPLSQATLWVVQNLLALCGLEVVCQPAEFLVGTPAFVVTIAPACSGYQGIGLVLVFLGVYLWLFRHELRFPHAFLLLPIGTLIVWLVNAARIALLIVLGSFVSESVATEGFHSHAGWLAFNAIALGIVAFTQRSGFLTNRRASASAPNAAAGYLVPFLALVATALVTGALSSGFDYLYPLRVAVVAAVLFFFRQRYGALQLSWSWEALAAGVAVFALWVALDFGPFASAPDSSMADVLARLPAGWAAVWLAFRALGYVITVPVAEELAFRGYLTRRLISADFEAVALGRFTWFSFVASSLVFGVLHGRWLAGMLAGMLYAAVLYRRGRLGDCVLAHAITNALLALCALGTGRWALWS
jgi:exosortase E/protease (VPEID-CTERM system)